MGYLGAATLPQLRAKARDGRVSRTDLFHTETQRTRSSK